MKCGGFNKTKINKDHIQLIDNLKNEIEVSDNEIVKEFEILEVEQQVVAGINYRFKIKTPNTDNKCFFLKVYKDLHNQTSISSIIKNKEIDDILEI